MVIVLKKKAQQNIMEKWVRLQQKVILKTIIIPL